MKYKVVEGDLIQLALAGEFDVIAHGCNCFCIQGAGIAAQMAKNFRTHDDRYYTKEDRKYEGDYDKLGTIDYAYYVLEDGLCTFRGEVGSNVTWFEENKIKYVTVVNCYTQFKPGPNADYDAVRMCMKKMNHFFKDKHIGLPKIGCAIGGLHWNMVEMIVQRELKDCNVTIVEYVP